MRITLVGSRHFGVTTLNTLRHHEVDIIRVVATLLQPVMPDSMRRMLDQLGVAPEARTFAALATPLTDGQSLPPPQGVFPRYVEPAA